MVRLKTLSGAELLRIFSTFGFQRISQKGSHVKMRRVVEERPQTLTIPLHGELDRGTLRAILRQASRYIAENELRPHFYAD